MQSPSERTAKVDLPWLHEVGLEARQQVGSKAAALGALHHMGVPTPDGFCIPEPVLASLFSTGPEDAAWQAVQAAYGELSAGKDLVAVRSSAGGEDGQAASYAGQFETVTSVQTWDELRAALLHCWQAAQAERVKIYQLGREASMGSFSLLVQRQVDARVSGVLFTRHPVSGAEDPLLVEAALGLGEDLVAGRTSPWRVRLERTGQVEIEEKEAAPDLLAQVPWVQLAQAASQIEAHLGPGQDIEWAYGSCCGKQQLWILQARPVTTGAGPLPVDAYWTRANVAEVLPDPVTPLTWSVFQYTLLGGRSPSQEYVRLMNGRVYLRLDVMLSTFGYLPAVTPQVMARVLGVNLPAPAGDFSVPAALPVRMAQGLFLLDALGGLPRLGRLLRGLPDMPPPGAKYLPNLLDWTSACFALHLKTTAYAIGAYAVLARLFELWLPEGQGEALLAALLHGQADLQTAAQGRELWQMAAEIGAHPALASLIAARLPWKVFPWQAERLDGGVLFLDRLEHFLARHGARAAGEFELAVPRWQENPAAVLDVLASYLHAQRDGAQFAGTTPQELAQRRQASLNVLEQALNPVQLWIVRRLLRSYPRYTTWRENMKYRLMQGYARLRLALLEVGRDRVAAGQLPKAEDIFFLRLDELPGFKFSAAPVPGMPEIEARRLEHARWLDTPAPVVWTAQDTKINQQVESGPGELYGIGCSQGVIESRARVILHIHQGRQLQPGEVLVAPHTDPGWTPLFLTCSAVVTEVGGFLSHGATVAREYGLPCVVNVPDATRRIHTGDRIRVDGAAGRITLLEGEGVSA